jgi:hypothetical protein
VTERVGFGSIAAVQVSYLALGLTLDLFPSENLCPKYRRQADNSCALNSKYRATCRPKWPARHYDSKLPKPHENPARLSFRLFDGLARILDAANAIATIARSLSLRRGTRDGNDTQERVGADALGADPALGSKTIKEAKMATFNARAETVGTKRSFVTQRLGQNALTFVIRLNATRQRTSM